MNMHKIEAAARRTHRALASTTDRMGLLKKVVAEADLVFGVFPDASGRLAYRIIKGELTLDRAIATRTPAAVNWTAVPCICVEQAEALRRTLGDTAVLQ